MTLIKLAARTGKAFGALWEAVKADRANAGKAVRETIRGAVEGAKTGDLGTAYLKQRKVSADLGKKIKGLREKLVSQANHNKQQHDKFKGKARDIINKHKTKEKIIGGLGVGGTIGALASKRNKDQVQA